ncbi:MAG: hypothetical protein H0W65_01915 [Sphingomonas sp.]|uniref:hypothetical protein n=1 Tax=Sphingomonas sp. TaxID=28214 RepID=UPI00179465A1|nr:hypothetical protein [Sphingomonas sp.]MBA3666465.1 hypothetical protein [Sphingomonas sp.]
MISVLFSVLLLASDAAVATPAQPAPTAAQASTAESKICRPDPAYTGTRMRKRLCLTQNQWDLRGNGKSAGDLKTIGAR